MKNFKHLFIGAIALLSLYSCNNTQDELSNIAPTGKEEFATFSLETQAHDDLRAIYSHTASNGHLTRDNADVPVVVVLYKQSTNKVKVHKTTWKAAGAKLTFGHATQAKLALPEGATASDQDLWIAAIFGGGVTEVNHITANLTATINASKTLATVAANKVTMDIPYVLPWRKLKATTNGIVSFAATTVAAQFKQMGAIIRFKVQNNSGANISFTGMKVASNVMAATATLNLGKPQANSADAAVLPSYTFSGTVTTDYTATAAVNVANAATSAYYYFWSPVATVSANRNTTFTLLGANNPQVFQTSAQLDNKKNNSLPVVINASDATVENPDNGGDLPTS